MPGHKITISPFKQAVMAIPDPTQMAYFNFTVLCVVTGHLVTDLRGRTEFRSEYHTHIIKDGRSNIRRQLGQEDEEAFDAAVGKLTNFNVDASVTDGRQVGASLWCRSPSTERSSVPSSGATQYSYSMTSTHLSYHTMVTSVGWVSSHPRPPLLKGRQYHSSLVLIISVTGSYTWPTSP